MSSSPAPQRLSASLELPFYQVTLYKAPFVLRGRNPRALSAEEVTETCELLLAAAAQHRCPYWLLDGRANAEHQPVELHEWMREEYFPRVRAVLGQQLQVAFLVKPAVWHGLRERGYEAPQDWASFALHAGWFTEELPALAWLQRQQTARPPAGSL
ncbi:hypothetical protein [Hymenobacter glacieicola]|nr:hypothetical protein [Hymenobacter glacieicola]